MNVTTATTTCKAFQLTDFAVQAIEESQRETRAPQGHEVLIAVKAASLNFRDLMVARGVYSKAIKLPVVPLSDGAGEVIAVGDKVRKEVVCPTLWIWLYVYSLGNACG